MKVLVIGGTGTIGSSVVKELQANHHEVFIATHSKGIKVDVTNEQSIEAMYKEANQQAKGKLDAVIVTLGNVKFNSFDHFNEKDLQFSLDNKFLVQVKIVQKALALKAVSENASFTLTSGILNRRPILTGIYAAIVNGAIDGFVKQMSLELPKGMRINVVSPTVVTEALDKYGSYFPNFASVDAAELAKVYHRSIASDDSGEIYCVDSNADAKNYC